MQVFEMGWVASIHELPRRGLLGNPYSVLWIASLVWLLRPPGYDEKPDAPRKHEG
jgi:hypothetical protein